MPNYKDLPQELTRTRTNEAVSELVDLKVHTATDIEAQEVSPLNSNSGGLFCNTR